MNLIEIQQWALKNCHFRLNIESFFYVNHLIIFFLILLILSEEEKYSFNIITIIIMSNIFFLSDADVWKILQKIKIKNRRYCQTLSSTTIQWMRWTQTDHLWCNLSSSSPHVVRRQPPRMRTSSTRTANNV